MELLDKYKKLVSSDPGFRNAGPVRRVGLGDMGRAVKWMGGSGQYVWLKDLFRLVFGFHVEEAEMTQRKGVVVQA